MRLINRNDCYPFYFRVLGFVGGCYDIKISSFPIESKYLFVKAKTCVDKELIFVGIQVIDFNKSLYVLRQLTTKEDVEKVKKYCFENKETIVLDFNDIINDSVFESFIIFVNKELKGTVDEKQLSFLYSLKNKFFSLKQANTSE